ncbi:T9SS type A sorting domain-containing protein [Sediminibacterium sp.]|uniref:T9SS type A sorting domain-containing protein n=1 Tax=Sediminibacterium sp. TaxID=1917865 RepID=UPI00273399F9|nr:T9SS type A sorting domain-containing protein [Sediminibacterium sp.]MDP3567348.1 T9SS type A sorting domain-containing protein [Sediminibacterium sp.]
MNFFTSKFIAKVSVRNLFLLFLFVFYFNCTAQIAPGIEWRKETFSPRGLDGQLQTQQQSGEEWWYSLKNVLDAAGQHTAYVTSGYTGLVSTAATSVAAEQMYNEGPDSPYNPINSINFNYSTQPAGCVDRDYIGEHRTPVRGNIGLNALNGDMIYCKTKTVGALEEVIQDPQNLDYAYVVGVHQGVRPFKNKINFIPYNRTAASSNDNFSLTRLGVNNYFNNCGHLYVAKIEIVTGTVVWEGLYGYPDYLPSPLNTYECKSYGYDIIKSSNGNLIVTGSAQIINAEFAPEYPIILEIDPTTGNLLKKTILPLNNNNVLPLSNPGSGYSLSGVGRSLVEIGTSGNYAIACAYYFVNTTNEDKNNAFVWCVDQNLNPSNTWQDNPIRLAGNGPFNSNIWEIKYHNALRQLLIPVVSDCIGCSYAGHNSGKGKIYRYNDDGSLSTNGINPSLMGDINAFDLRIGVEETSDGGFVAVSSVRPPTADHSPPTATELGYLQHCPDLEFDVWDTDALVVKFTNTGALLWSKTFDIEANRPRKTPPEDLKRQECMYKITQTQDGGYTICGNASANFDDFYMAKLYNECNAQQSYTAGPNYIFDITSNTTWTESQTILGKIIVHPGVTFNVTGPNTIIRFADSRLTGIETNLTVMLGGQLTLTDGAQLAPIDNLVCQNSNWDGVKMATNPSAENTLLLFPNPTNSNFSILYNGTDILEANYSIVDVLGKELKSGVITSNVSQEINTTTFSEGVYVVSLTKNNKTFQKQKLVVLKH